MMGLTGCYWKLSESSEANALDLGIFGYASNAWLNAGAKSEFGEFWRETS